MKGNFKTHLLNMIGLSDSLISRAGTYFEFDADQKWRTEMHSGFIYEPKNLWR
jgi:hypothetical protein